MSSTPREREQRLAALGSQLGAPPPPSLARLDDAQLSDLVEAIGEARRRQAAELAAAGEQAFRLLPRVLRGPIRRLMG